MKRLWPYVGNQELADRLATTIDQGRLPTPMVFVGPTGIGKRSGALWLASYEHCQAPTRPCGTCVQCRNIATGHHPHVLEVGGGEESVTVDEIRQLFQQFHYVDNRPTWLILNASTPVSEAVWNTCLKMFEEPPAFLRILIIATDDKHIPATIRSRTAIIRWSRLNEVAMRRAFPNARREDILEAQGCPGRMTAILNDESRTAERQRAQTLVQCALAALPIAEAPESLETLYQREELEYRRLLLESLEQTEYSQARIVEFIRRLFFRHALQKQNVSPHAIYAYTHLA